MKKLPLIAFLAIISAGYVASGCSSSKGKAQNDSTTSVDSEAARLDSLRQDSIARRNFTTPDLAFNDLHGHVAKCESGSESELYYPAVYSYNTDGVLENSKVGENSLKSTRNKDGQIIAMEGDGAKFVYKWSDDRISSKQLEYCEGETAYGNGATHYFYNSDGVLTHTTTDGGEGENGKMRNMKTVYSDYQFDEMGNWISRKSTTTYQVDEYGDGSWNNRTDTDKEVRVITYYDSEIGKDRQGLLSRLREQREKSIGSEARQETKNNIPDWMQGVWHLDINGPNGISVANYTMTIDGDYATMLDGRQTKYSGECHIDNGKLYLGSSFSFDINGQSLYYRQYRLTKDGGSYSWSGRFSIESDVMRYLTARTFYSSSHRMAFTYNSVTIDGYAVSGAPRISNFTSTTATIAVSPMGGGRTVYLNLNAPNGTINYEGDTFYAR